MSRIVSRVSRSTAPRATEPGSLDVEGRAVQGLLAREAGCSRATLYRYFASRQAVLDVTVSFEVQRILAALRDAARDADTLEDAIVAILVTAGRELGGHPALTFVAAFEPERLLPQLAFANGDR